MWYCGDRDDSSKKWHFLTPLSNVPEIISVHAMPSKIHDWVGRDTL